MHKPKPKGELVRAAHKAAGYRALSTRAVMNETPERYTGNMYTRMFNVGMRMCEILDRILDEHHSMYREGRPISELKE